MQSRHLANTRIASGLLPLGRLGARSQPLDLVQVRLNSSRAHRSLLSHFSRALGWGLGIGVAIGGIGYGAYYLSGWKEKVDSAHKALESVQRIVYSSKDTSKKASDLLNLARTAVKMAVASVIPFGAKLSDPLVDKAFDTVDSAIDAHGEEAKVIIAEMMQDILAAIDAHKEWPTAAIAQVVLIVRREMAKLRELASKPETKEKVAAIKQAAIDKSQDGWERVKEVASQENINRVKEYIGEEKLAKASSVGQKITGMIWKKGKGDDESK